MMVGISFSQKPSVALAYLKAKHPKLHFDYDEIMHEAHHKAFTVAKVTKLDLLTDIQDSLIKAKEQGETFATWKKQLIPTLKAKGWYGRTEVANPKTGEVKEIFVGSKRLKNIFYTNSRVAYNVGRWEHQAQLDDAPYLRYVAILDNRNRPSHGKNHGVVRHRDDPFWQTNYPPNGWNCRCRVQAHSLLALKSRGWDGGLKAPAHPVASADWSYDVRTRSRASLEAYAQKRYPDILEPKDIAVRQKQLDEMIEEIIVKNNQKYPTSVIQIGTLSSAVIKALKELADIEAKVDSVALEKNRLMHAAPTRKAKYAQALRIEEYRKIVDVILEAKSAYIDTTKKNIIYTFDDIQDKTKLNKIVIHPNRTVKKFHDENGNKQTNATITLSKIKKENMREKRYKRVDTK